MLNCFFSWLISPSLYIDFLFTDGHDTDTAKFGKVKVQNSVGLKYKFYKQCWRYPHSGQVSVGQQNWTIAIPLKKRTAGGTPSYHHYFVTWLWQILISQILIHSEVQISWYFSKVSWPYYDGILAPGEECHLDFSSKSCTYPSLVTRDPLEIKIILILLYENNNCPTLFCIFTIGNSSFLTTVKKKMSCVSLFSIQKFLIYKFKLLSLLKPLYSMSNPTYIHDLLPVTPWRHSKTQTWPNKPLQYLGIKL